jgi:hypothetical protein
MFDWFKRQRIAREIEGLTGFSAEEMGVKFNRLLQIGCRMTLSADKHGEFVVAFHKPKGPGLCEVTANSLSLGIAMAVKCMEKEINYEIETEGKYEQ